MSNIVFETSTTLYPRLDKSYQEVAVDAANNLLDCFMDYEKLDCSAIVTENENGTATLYMKVYRPKRKFSFTFKYAMWFVSGIAISGIAKVIHTLV